MSALDDELAKPISMPFAALEVLAPTFSLRFLDGASEVTFPVPDPVTDVPALQTFKGSDDTFGTMGALRAMTEGLGMEAPRMRIEIRPPTLTAAATLCLPTNQGSLVRLFIGAIHLETGAIIETSVEFIGKLDVPRYMGGKARRVEYDVFSPWELLFAESEGDRLNDAKHREAFPLERGLEYVTDVERQLPWGGDVPKSPAISSTQGTNYGGGGTGFGGGSSGGGGGSTGGGGYSGGGGGGRTTQQY